MTNKTEKLSAWKAGIDAGNPARARLSTLFDPDSFVELDAFMQSGENEAGVVAGYGFIEGGIVYAYSQDVAAVNGAVNAAQAKKINKVYELAAKTGCPIVCIYDSKGAKIDEGAEMLSAYSTILKSANNLSGVVPQIAVVLGTCAGVSAVLAAGADVLVMSKNAELFLTAPFTAKANGEDVKGAGSAEFAAESGVAAILAEDDAAALAEVRKLIPMLPQNNLSPLPMFEYSDAEPASADITSDTVAALADADSLVELYGAYGKAASTYLATVAGATTAFVATCGESALDADACEKIAHFVKLCDAFNIPVVTLLDSEGFAITSDAKLIKEAAKLASAYAEATTAKISLITGKAYGAAYVALGAKNTGADVTLAWPQSEISALAPVTAVEFLWADRYKGTEDVKATRAQLVDEYVDTVASPFEAAKGGYIEAVIAPEETRSVLISTLDMLTGKRESKLPKKHVTL